MMILERTITSKILHWIGKNKILILKGSRQVGKTTLLKGIQKNLEKEGKTTFYMSIDQELENPILKNSKNLLIYLKNQFPDIQKNNKLFLFLDEFQYLENAGIFLKTLFDAGQEYLQIIVSGSSSLEITKNTEFLTGRKIEFQLYPFSYCEFVEYKSGIKFEKKISIHHFSKIQEWYEIYKNIITEPLQEYMNFGGYPEVVTISAQEDKKIVLKELARTYIEKDIIAFLKLENITAFTNLLKIIAHQIGNLVNKSEISNTLNISINTVNKYLEVLEGTYLIEFLRPYFINIRTTLSKMPKVYMNDFGIRNTILQSNAPENYIAGNERENFIYNTLKEQFDRESIKFYRTISKSEIDFIVEGNGYKIPIEVKSIKKEIKAPSSLKYFEKKIKNVPFSIIVTDDVLKKTADALYIPTTVMPFIEY